MRGLLILAVVVTAWGLAACGGAGGSTNAGSTQSAGTASASSNEDGFKVPGEENKLFGFFEEASPAQIREISDNLTAYMKARASGDWQAMCRYLAPRQKGGGLQAVVAERPGLKGKACPAIVAAVAGPSASRANTMAGPVDAARQAGGVRALALYHGNDGADYMMPMLIHYGDWEVAYLSPVKIGPTQP